MAEPFSAGRRRRSARRLGIDANGVDQADVPLAFNRVAALFICSSISGENSFSINTSSGSHWW